MADHERAKLNLKKYKQKAVRDRIRAFFLDNLGKVVTREQIVRLAGGRENWHQRLSELRTDEGYTILSSRDRDTLTVSEYLMPSAERRPTAAKRVRPLVKTWLAILLRAGAACEWEESGARCGLREGEADPVGGGSVKLTPDHKTPHALDPAADPTDPTRWQALCGRHQVVKKNYWDSFTGKLNVYAIVQAASDDDKRAAFEFLKRYFGDD